MMEVSATNRFSQEIEALSESVFNDITGPPGDYAYDIRNITTDQDGFVVNFSKWNQPIISYEKALASAEGFLESNIEQVLLNNLSVIISAIRNDLPMWIIRFKGKYLEVKVGLNAFSGNPILLEIQSVDFQGAGIIEENEWITKEYVETKSNKFLEDNHYTVPIDAMYMGSEQVAILYDDDDYYCIFEQIIGGLRVRSYPTSNPIPDMGIVIQVDSYTGMVV